MKVAMVSTWDLAGGAARSAYRLHRGLVDIGVHSRILVQEKSSDDSTVIGQPRELAKIFAKARPLLEGISLRINRPVDNRTAFSTAWLPEKLVSRVAAQKPDIVHLHWVNYGFVRIETLARLPRPLVWTLHDMWAFTGGCHYDGGCGRYTDGCGQCPMLAAPGPRDLSTRVLGRKINSWRGLDLTIVTPSRWLGECAKASALFRNLRVETIPYGLDLTRFRPFDKALARDILGLPRDKDLILFGAANPDDRRKGFSHLQEAVGRLAAVGAARNAELIVFGSSRPANPPPTALPVHYTGPLNDEISLSLLYSAADVFVAPSLQDNLPNTIMEAMACGTPCVAFRIGGMPDMIDHDVNGFLAPPFDSQALADGVAALLSDPARRAAFGAAARKKCELEFPAARSATAYRELYAELLGHEANKRAG